MIFVVVVVVVVCHAWFLLEVLMPSLLKGVENKPAFVKVLFWRQPCQSL